MSTIMAQLNTRVPADLKRGGDAVFSRYGLSASEVVRGVWRFAVENQSVPEFLLEEKPCASVVDPSDGCGLAVRVAAQECGFVDAGLAPEYASWQDERDAMYDDLLTGMDERCG